MASNSSSCPTPGGGHLNSYPVPPYAFFFPHMLGGLSPPSTLAGIQHQLPVSGYSTPSPASEYRGPAAGGGGTPGARGGVQGPLSAGVCPQHGTWVLGTSFRVSLLVLPLGKLRHGAGRGTWWGVCELIAAVWPPSLMAVFIPWLLTAQLALVRGHWLSPSPAPTAAGLGDGGLGGGGQPGMPVPRCVPVAALCLPAARGPPVGGGDEGNHRVCS